MNEETLIFLQQGSILKTTAPLWIMADVSVMSTSASHKKYLDTIMNNHCQGDDTFVAFQPMGIFHFWRNLEINYSLFKKFECSGIQRKYGE